MANNLISELNNYIINAIRSIRIELGLSQIGLSKDIDPLTDTNIIGLVESEKTTTTYNDHHLNTIAKVFSERAKLIEKEKCDYTIFDFYPNEPVPEKSMKKIVDPVPKSIKATGTLNLLIETNDLYLQDWHTVKEITDYCSNFAKQEWKTTDFTSVVSRAEATGKLIRQGENEPKYKKR